MILVRILIGLCGLGIVVFVHELGHFLAARAAGIDVEAFSIGWGNPLLKKKIGKVEYRLGMFPIGGYCKMRGEAEFREALMDDKKEIPREKGTFFGASPLRRMGVAFAGPFANAVFAVLALALVWGVGFEQASLGNRIVLASDYEAGASYPADVAGLKTGDRIVAVQGKPTTTHAEVQEAIMSYPGKDLALAVDREGEKLDLTVVPKLDPDTGAALIGVTFWVDPEVSAVRPGSAAAIAGLRAGDLITGVEGEAVPHVAALRSALRDKPAAVRLDIARGGVPSTVDLVPSWREDGSLDLGLEFRVLRYRSPQLNPAQALAKGASEAWKTFAVSARGLTLLFKGVNLTKAVSGPVRITYMVGEVAEEGFGRGFSEGFSSLASFLALLSIALFLMNLLPIPALDGGMIVLFAIEAARGKPLKPRFVYAFQAAGAALVMGLLLFSLFGDILFLFGR